MAHVRPKPVILLIFDGFGIAPPGNGNAVTLSKKPVLDQMIATYPTLTLQASGEAVGLSWGEMGNSEVCHLNLGAGRIIYQTLPRINKAIDDGSFFKNEALVKAVEHVKKHKSRLHLMGLVSNGGVHSHQNHVYALLDFCSKKQLSDVFVHAFIDGRDTAKDGAAEFIGSLQRKMDEVKVGKIASISGRFHAMDRDNHWDRIEKAYRAIVEGTSPSKGEDAVALIKKGYQNKMYDEEFTPTVITQGGKPVGPINSNDAVIFFNFRADRARQMTAAFTLPGFDKFKREYLKDLLFVTLTQYEKDLPVSVAYPPQSIVTPIGQILQDNNLSQLHAAETEKYAHVTFFFNCGRDEPFKNEDRILVPSPSVTSYDQKPEMSVYELTDKIVAAIKEEKHDFMVINFANPDMLGHTGVIPAAIKAIEACDKCLGKLYDAVVSRGGTILLTADHGNCDEMINLQTGEVDKEHSTNPVPFVVIGKRWEGQTLTAGLDSAGGDLSVVTPSGILADITPTILKIMEIKQPDVMTGTPLI